MANTHGCLQSVCSSFEAFRIQEVMESLSNPCADKGNLISAVDLFSAGGETAACDFLVGSTDWKQALMSLALNAPPLLSPAGS